MQEKKTRRQLRRVIRVGSRAVTGAVCTICPMRTVIYPDSTLAAHMARHGAASAVWSPEPRARYRRGRPPGATNRRHMSSTGVERKSGIREQSDGSRH